MVYGALGGGEGERVWRMCLLGVMVLVGVREGGVRGRVDCVSIGCVLIYLGEVA